ncbi:hypothetical protein Ssi02_65120 [Sinosporangium siamense]|uniref:Uncharacterized protein n=1 Tax=Sinosporangium siamense TaxID=1367973 RepID=A0A919RPY3_9ACTN|nr:hypothetical protein Ssi02_65120 [Sinosporangium siamense]
MCLPYAPRRLRLPYALRVARIPHMPGRRTRPQRHRDRPGERHPDKQRTTKGPRERRPGAWGPLPLPALSEWPGCPPR